MPTFGYGALGACLRTCGGDYLDEERALRPPYVTGLSALVNLQNQPLKGIFLTGHQQFPVQYQFSRTRQPLYLKLHTNYRLRAPLVGLFLSPCRPLSPSTSFLANQLALPPCPLRRAGERARDGGPASSSPTRPSLHIPSAPLELLNPVGGQCFPSLRVKIVISHEVSQTKAIKLLLIQTSELKGEMIFCYFFHSKL
jgi:hypothetical protein